MQKTPQNMTKPFRAPFQYAAFDATFGSPTSLRNVSVPQINTGSHLYLKNPRKHVIACVSGMGQIVRMLVEMNAGVFTSSSWAGLASQTHQLERAKA